jgi:hypothetical protein
MQEHNKLLLSFCLFAQLSNICVFIDNKSCVRVTICIKSKKIYQIHPCFQNIISRNRNLFFYELKKKKSQLSKVALNIKQMQRNV